MAFGNRRNEQIDEGLDEAVASLTGVVPRTRMTRSGFRALEGEFKFSAAGDDLVGGLTSGSSLRPISEMRTLMPMLHRRLKRIATTLRRYMGTDQEIEFTVESGRLSILQTRMSETHQEKEVHNFAEPGEPLTHGIGVRGGGFRGAVAFSDDDRRELAEQLAAAQRDDVDGVLLVLENPTPDDVPLIMAADGLLTAKGGSTSHAAVAINGIDGKEYSAVMGAHGLKVNAQRDEAVFLDAEREARHRVRKGDVISIHGTSGEVYVGSLPLAG
jgi:pyruvate,orthophosphate dikinase